MKFEVKLSHLNKPKQIYQKIYEVKVFKKKQFAHSKKVEKELKLSESLFFILLVTTLSNHEFSLNIMLLSVLRS